MNKLHAIGVIPVRLESKRFPRKALADIEGLPMIVHVLKRTQLCADLEKVYVATDSAEIKAIVEKAGGNVLMTSSTHETGTDRIAEAVRVLECDVVINIQGDEPLVRPEHISKVLSMLEQDRDLEAATLYCETDQLGAGNEVKMVTDLKGNILYMSRSDVPSTVRTKHRSLKKCYNLVGFRKQTLLRFASSPQAPLEKIEFVEYLRLLENGVRMRAALITDPIQSIDTPQDLEDVRRMMTQDALKRRYLPDSVTGAR